MLLKLRNIEKRQVNELIQLEFILQDQGALKDFLVCDEFFRQMAKTAEFGDKKWTASVVKLVEGKRSDTRPSKKDDESDCLYHVTLEVVEEFSLAIGGSYAGKHKTPRNIINAVFDICGLFPAPLN